MRIVVLPCLLAALADISSGFIFNGPGGFGGGGGMCMPLGRFCPLQCAAYEHDGHGCEICHCKTDGVVLQQVTKHTIHNPCIPTQGLCPLKCEEFVRGGGGCEYCQCAQTQQTSTTAPSTAAPMTTTAAPITVPRTTTPGPTVNSDCLIARQICNAKCNGQYLVDPSDCTFCICKSEIHSRK